MATNSFSGQLKDFIEKAENGTVSDVDYLMGFLTSDPTFAITRYIDFALSLVTNPDGFERIKFYLLNGTLIQRNYASLYLNRLGHWKFVKEAFDKGLIDEIQAFAR
jgi:hypothetical protein